jgi:hypothetical protein
VSVAIIVEIVITYLTALCLFLVSFPNSVLFDTSDNFIILIRVTGIVCLTLIFLAPLLINKYAKIRQLFVNQKALFYAVLLRTCNWLISGLGFYFLTKALGFPDIGLSLASAIIPASFFVSFLVFFLPDGVVVRETIIIYMLRDVLSSADATILSLVYRFFLIILEFIVILVIFLIWKSTQKRIQSTD